MSKGTVLRAATGVDGGSPETWSVRGTVIEAWNEGMLGPQPSDQQIRDWETDADLLPSGQTFSQWLAEHGGDATLTARRKARELIDRIDEDTALALRALALVVIDEINILRADVDAMSKETNQLTDRDRPARTKGQVLTAFGNKIESGDAE